MDLLLITLTVISLAAALGFAVVTWRLFYEERRRSAARVAALSQAIDAQTPGVPTPPVAVSSMFTTQSGASVAGRPLIKAAVVGVMAIAIVVYAAMSGREPTTGSTARASLPSHAQAPLELLSMRHTRNGGSLTITGLVRNPADGSEARRVAAVVFVFDRAGSFVTSGRAPLDFAVLEPGGESPFVVTVPDAGDVARYRVSFRTDEGVVRHVDRRAEQLQLAQH